MTYKSIVENVVERTARQQLDRVLNRFNKEIYLDFGAVKFTDESKEMKDFTVTIKELGGFPLTYEVYGYVNEYGFVTIVFYKINSKRYDIGTGKEI